MSRGTIVLILWLWLNPLRNAPVTFRKGVRRVMLAEDRGGQGVTAVP